MTKRFQTNQPERKNREREMNWWWMEFELELFGAENSEKNSELLRDFILARNGERFMKATAN